MINSFVEKRSSEPEASGGSDFFQKKKENVWLRRFILLNLEGIPGSCRTFSKSSAIKYVVKWNAQAIDYALCIGTVLPHSNRHIVINCDYNKILLQFLGKRRRRREPTCEKAMLIWYYVI
jgi:hypothetical protein